jgi:hypothetical protein
MELKETKVHKVHKELKVEQDHKVLKEVMVLQVQVERVE